MENKLIQLLQKFSASELRQLKDFIISPFFNKNAHITQLILTILNNLAKGNLTENEDEFLFTAIWKEIPYDKMKIARLRYKAFLLIEEFLMQLRLKDKYAETAIHLLEFYADNNIEKLHDDVYEKLNSLQSQNPLRDSYFYYQQFVIDESASRYQTQKQQRNLSLNLQEMESHLNVFFIARKLELACYALGRKSVVHSEFQPDLLAEILLYLQNQPKMKEYPPIEVYYALYQMLKSPNEELLFANFQAILTKNALFFSLKERKNLHSYERNHCIAAINKGANEFIPVLFNIYDNQLKAGWLYNETGELMPTNFKNIVVTALRLDETAWVAQFLEDYSPKLPKEERADTYNYCLGKLYFAQKAYSKTLKLLQSIDFEDVFLNIAARKLLMQTYFELQEWEGLLSSLNTFRVFLHRDKTLSENHKNMNRNFANLLRRITESIQSQENDVAELRRQVESTSPLSEKGWLLAKIQGL